MPLNPRNWSRKRSGNRSSHSSKKPKPAVDKNLLSDTVCRSEIKEFMPNTKSAGRRMRNSARKQLQNRSTKSRLGTLEKKYSDLVAAGKKAEATAAYSEFSSALDKAAKTGTVHRSTASRKKSRLALRLNK